MRIRIGFEIAYQCPQPTPAILSLRVHPSRVDDLEAPDVIVSEPWLPISEYIDGFGNICSRLTFPAGLTTIRTDTVIRDSGLPDPVVPAAAQLPVEALPSDCLVFLLGSRYCETDRLMETAWSLFGTKPPGWARVQAICDYVHEHVTFGYEHARPTKTAIGRAYRARRRLPRLRPPCRHLLPLHEHPGALLHRLSRRYRCAAGPGADGLQRLVRGLSRRTTGTPSTPATTCPASAAS